MPLPFVQKSVAVPPRPHYFQLSLTSMIDCLVVLVVFLLMTFAASNQCPVGAVDHPRAGNVRDMFDAPVVSARGAEVMVDGTVAGSTLAIEGSNRVERIDSLFQALKAKRDLFQTTHPGRDYPGRVLLEIDQNEPAVVVKSIFLTAALAGSPNVGFVVEKL